MREMRLPDEEGSELQGRCYGLLVVITLALLALLTRAWHLQVTEGAYYYDLSENNRIRIVPISPPRGLILDRHGALLVNNSPSFNLYVVGGDMPNPEQVFGRLADFIEIDKRELVRRVTSRREDPYFPIKIKNDLSMKEVAAIEGRLLELPGVSIQVEFKRTAIHNTLAGHLLGYVGEISQTQIESGAYKDAKPGDIVGQYGIEQSYDSVIRGIPGQKGVEVDALGHEIRPLKVIQPKRGRDVRLTLDLNLQKAAEEALGGQAGAIVAIDPSNGEVLAMVSHPPFDPNRLSRGVSSREWRDLLSDAKRPLNNRAIQGTYPPGSTFKIILSTALLQTKTANPFSRVECRGQYPFGNRTFRDWKKGGHGSVELHRALVESCDVYFYEMGNRLGVDAIARFSNLFGLGKPTGIDLASEKGGLIPSTEWKKRVRHEPWYPGETLSVAIGQGYVSVTPLQMAVMMAAVARNGVWYPPQIVKQIRDDQTGQVEEIHPKAGRDLGISQEAMRIIQNALTDVVSAPNGTAYRSRSEKVSIAGKTGTAQVLAIPEKGERKKFPAAFDDHAWFVAFAPVGNPKIALVVLVEHGGHGASAAAPLAKRVIEQYLTPPDPASQIKEAVARPVPLKVSQGLLRRGEQGDNG